MARHGTTRHDMARHGTARHDAVRTRHDTTRHVITRRGATRHDTWWLAHLFAVVGLVSSYEDLSLIHI
eukprot:6006555-Alexandrium_andersonii.AAC.1